MKLRRPTSPAYATPREAIAYLASVCDGAVRRDGHGFATDHVLIGHGLARRQRWRRSQRRNALALIRYYRSQLERAGFDVGSLLAGQPARVSRRSVAAKSPTWAADPSGIFNQRFWNGARWTSLTA